MRLFLLLALLYFAQGLPSGLIAKALPALLRDQGVSLSLIGFTSALALPWALKFLWAPLVDRYGTRRQWLLGLNGLTMALMLVVASRDFEAWIDRLPWLLAVLFCANAVSATQDIATDGYAVTMLKPRWRGLGNSIQVVGYKLGMVMGSGGLLWLVAHHGWQASYGGLACLMLLVIVPVLFMEDARTPTQQAATHTRWQGLRGYAGVFRDFVAQPAMPWWLATIALYYPTFKGSVQSLQSVTPVDLEQAWGLTEGDLNHGQLILDQIFFMRPLPGWSNHRTPIDGLHLCGSGMHGGGGVSGHPGRNAARAILSAR
jgi:MFS family permease